MVDKCDILGIRKGKIEWTKTVEGQEAEAMRTRIRSATTKYDQWFVRQMLRSVEITSSALTEFGEPSAKSNMILFQTLMAEHEEEILNHIAKLNWNVPDVAQAYTLVAAPFHGLDNQGHIAKPVYVPNMIAYAIVELITHTAVEGGPTAQLVDVTAWVPKCTRRLLKQIDTWIATNIETPEWITGAITERARGSEERDKAAACKRMGGAAPGEPDDGGLVKAKPKVPSKAKKWNSNNRGLDQPPWNHIDDRATYGDGKDNKTRPIGMQARFETTHGGRTRCQLHVWCVCDESKAVDRQWRST